MPRWLDYVLVVPAYRSRARRSLRWRLFGSHLLAVFMVPGVVLLLLGVVAVVVVGTTHHAESGAADAETVARYAVGGTLPLGIGVVGVHSVSFVGLNSVVTQSSDRGTVGKTPDEVVDGASAVVARALSGSTSLRDNTRSYSGPPAGEIGAYPVRNPGGELIGAILVDEPTSRDARSNLVGRIVTGISIAAIVGSAIFLIPALIIASILGFERARSISRPVRGLSEAAAAFAGGDLSRRVAVRGEDEVAALGRNFNAMADRLQETMTQQAADRALAESALNANRELIANVSHELRTPVSVIRAHLEAHAEAAPVAEFEDYLRIAMKETDRLESLVEDLFELSRIESGGVTVEERVFDAAAAVREATESLAEPARREAAVTVRAEATAGPVNCIGDPGRIVQVLQNLIRNAIRFTPEGGIVLVGVVLEDAWVALSVRDTGSGIAAADLPLVFDRFYRGERSRSRASGGAGLGLAISRDLVEAMHGTLAAESAEGEGSIFTIRLRAAPGQP
ncbi:MAG: sensor histidine kinase [Tepidiformaceae bacterium]